MGDIHGKHPCGQCGKKFWLRTELDMHMKTIHSSKCCECEKLFENEMDLQVHIKQTHMYVETVLENTTSDNPDTISLEELSEQSELERVVENPKCLLVI